MLDWPLTAAAVALEMNGNTVKSARVVLGHVAPTPWRSSQAEQVLAGKAVSEDVAMAAGKAAVADGDASQQEQIQGAARPRGGQARRAGRCREGVIDAAARRRNEAAHEAL